jgi:hypothetical protein
MCCGCSGSMSAFRAPRSGCIFSCRNRSGNFGGAIGKALQHFKGVLEKAKTAPGPGDTDPKSPMEKKVLAWLNQTQLMQRFGAHIEIDAQYPIGEYLRQLDPTYQHPNYKVDFLIKIRGAEKSISIIVEYDGLKEHFTDLDEIDASNYGLYMKPEDVERQKVLESYGYSFLPVNRFNLGNDPVRTLDERLARMAREALQAARPHPLVAAMLGMRRGQVDRGISGHEAGARLRAEMPEL